MSDRKCAICGIRNTAFVFVYPWKNDPYRGALVCWACHSKPMAGPIQKENITLTAPTGLQKWSKPKRRLTKGT